MDNQDQETPSWFEMLKSSLKGLLFGLVLLLGGVILLFWNEGRGAKNSARLQQAESKIHLPSDIQRPSAKDNGKLVYVQSTLQQQSKLPQIDSELNLSVDALALQRKVEFWQWQEQESIDPTTKQASHSYSKQWSDAAIDSSKFKQPEGHQNKLAANLQTQYMQSSKLQLAGYELDREQVRKLRMEALKQPKPQASPYSSQMQIHGSYIYLLPREQAGAGTTAADTLAKTTFDPANLPVGTLRVSYQQLPAGLSLSIIAAQTAAANSGFSLSPHRSGDDEATFIVHQPAQSIEQMFAAERGSNNRTGWWLRALGVVILFIALRMILSPLHALVEYIPLLGDILQFGMNLLSALLALLLALLVIAVGWMFYRPLLSLSILAVVLLLGWLLWKLLGKKTATKQTTSQA